MKKLSFAIFFLILLFNQCATPQKKLENKDYEGAYKVALRQLKGNKKNQQENQRILVKALEKLLEQNKPIIQANAHSGDVERMEKAVTASEDLMNKIEEATPYMNGDFVAEFRELDQFRIDISFELYDFYLKEGLIQLEKAIEYGEKKEAQAAYADFKAARKYIDEQSSELDSLEQLAIEYGQVIYQVEATAPFELMHQWEIDRRFEDVKGESSPFYKILYEGRGHQVDCYLEVRFGSLRDRIEERSQTERFEEQIVDDYETVVDAEGNSSQRPIYKTVQGSVDIVTRMKTLTWEAEVNTRGNKYCNLSDTRLSAARISEIEEYKLTGDERAIPDRYKTRFSTDFEREEDMAANLLEQIYQEFLNYYF